jgi:hypothetical protein
MIFYRFGMQLFYSEAADALPEKTAAAGPHQLPTPRRRRNLGTFATRAAAARHERAVQFFKRRG